MPKKNTDIVSMLGHQTRKSMVQHIHGLAKTLVKLRTQTDDMLGMEVLTLFNKVYLEHDINVLHFSPKNKLSKDETALLLIMQAIDIAEHGGEYKLDNIIEYIKKELEIK